MSYDANPFDPFERIGSHGGLPGVQGRKTRRRRLPWLFGLLGLGLIYWFGLRGASPDPVEAAESAGGAGIVLDAAQGKPLVQPPVAGANGPAAPEVTAAPVVAPKPKPAARAPGAEALERQVNEIVARHMATAAKNSKNKVRAANTDVAVHVRGVDGAVWVDRSTSKALMPASNLKLVTCAAAMQLAPEGAAFETPFEALGEVRGGVLEGDLVARAGADPLYSADSDGSLDAYARQIAEQLRAAGIERVRGRLLLDEGRFERPGPGPEWPPSNEYWTEHCALSGGFSANAGCISAKVVPTSPGKEANVEVRPRGHGLKRIGTVNTTAKGSKIIVAVEARERGLTVRGSLPAGISGYETRFAYPDPVDLFGYGMLDSLARAGVAIEGGFERSRQVPAGREVARLRTPIVSAFLPILRDSNNSVADQLFLFLGHRYAGEGTRAGGARAVARALAGLGVDSDGWNQVDGSGLSKADRVRADQLTALLAGVFQRADADALALRQALPVAGESGTLRTRMRKGQAEGNVHAKTGWVEGASSLSGWAVTRGGRILIFSILINYPRHPNLNTSVFKPMQDEICEALASLR